MKSALKEIAVITCCSFTGVTVLFALLSHFDLAIPLSNTIALQIFCMCISTGLGMVAADKIIDAVKIETLMPEILLRLGICYVVVFFEGALFGMFSFNATALLKIAPILLPVYIVTHFATYYVSATCANEINDKIKQENEK